MAKSIAKENGVKCEWSTVGKIRDAMSVVYQHAQRHEILPARVEHNPAHARKLGGPKIKTKSGYKAVRVTPAQIKKMLENLPLLQQIPLSGNRFLHSSSSYFSHSPTKGSSLLAASGGRVV